MNTVKKQGNNKGVGKEVWYANLERGRWKQGQSWNPKGRKPKTFVGEAKQLRDEGYEKTTTEEVQEAFQMLIWLTKMKLIEVAADKSLPYSLCAVATWMLSDKYGMRIIGKILDRVYGKPSKSINHPRVTYHILDNESIALRDVKQREEI